MINREKQIRDAAKDFLCETQYMEDNVAMAFIEGAKWADETMLEEVLAWLDENLFDVHVLHDDRVEGNFESKEAMLKSFKEQFKF